MVSKGSSSSVLCTVSNLIIQFLSYLTLEPHVIYVWNGQKAVRETLRV